MPHSFYKCPFCEKRLREEYYSGHLFKKHLSNIFDDSSSGITNKKRLEGLATRYQSFHPSLPYGHHTPYMCLGCGKGNTQEVRLKKHLEKKDCLQKYHQTIQSLLGRPIEAIQPSNENKEPFVAAIALLMKQMKSLEEQIAEFEQDDDPTFLELRNILPSHLLAELGDLGKMEELGEKYRMKPKPIVKTSEQLLEESRKKKMEEEYQKEVEEAERIRMLPENQPRPVQVFTTPDPDIRKPEPELQVKPKRKPKQLQAPLETPAPTLETPAPTLETPAPPLEIANIQVEPVKTLEDFQAAPPLPPPPKGKQPFVLNRSFLDTFSKPKVDNTPRFKVLATTR